MTNPSSPEPNPLNIYSIGLKLRTLRNEKRLTLTALARETGYSTALLSKLETGNMVPTLQTLERPGPLLRHRTRLLLLPAHCPLTRHHAFTLHSRTERFPGNG